MPAFVTHELFGKELFRQFPSKIKELINRNPAPYFWGLQGPDLLFFRDPIRGKSQLPYCGGIMHSKSTDELFSILSGYVASHGFNHYSKKERFKKNNFGYISIDTKEYETLLSYSIGFIGHYVLDSNAHPYIYWLQEEKGKNSLYLNKGGIHSRIESDIDSSLYPFYSKRSIHEYNPAGRLYGSKREYGIIAGLYQFLLMELYGIDLSAKEVKKCFSKAKLIMKATMDPYKGLFLLLAKCYDSITGKPNTIAAHVRRDYIKEDILNLGHKEWNNLSNPSEPIKDSFLELMDKAILVGLEMVCGFYETTIKGEEYNPSGLVSFDNGSPEF